MYSAVKAKFLVKFWTELVTTGFQISGAKLLRTHKNDFKIIPDKTLYDIFQ